MRRSKKAGAAAKRRFTVGILIDGVTSFGRQIMRGVMRYANVERRWLIHEEMRNPQDPIATWPACDGAIIGGTRSAIFQEIAERSRFVIQCTGSPQLSDQPVVCLDDHAAGQMAAQHLLDCNLEHFGYFGWRACATSMNRAAGFISQLNERGRTCHTSEIRPNEMARNDTSHWPELTRWLRALPKPIGILCVDDSAARELAACCLQSQIPVPDRVAILGINNDDLLCESAWPPISSVEADFTRVGYLAAQTLDRLLRGEKIPAAERLVRLPPLGVVGRVSTDVLAVDDADLAEAVRFIRAHACDPCTVHDVLRHVPVGRRWLERQFVAKLGRTPHDEILRVRMDAATRLLTHTDFNLSDVARRCGFSAVASFVRAFARSNGDPPGKFRRAARRSA